MHHLKFKHKTQKEQKHTKQKETRKNMKSDIGKYRLLQTQLNDVRQTITNISVDENPTLVKMKLIPIINRIATYNEWFNNIGEKQGEREILKNFRNDLKNPEKRKELLELYKEKMAETSA